MPIILLFKTFTFDVHLNELAYSVFFSVFIFIYIGSGCRRSDSIMVTLLKIRVINIKLFNIL